MKYDPLTFVILGGSGLIGAAACRSAVEQGHAVVSVSRGGRPPDVGGWANQVRWVRADVFDVAAWRRHLEGADALVHCIGITREQPKQGRTFARLNGDAAILASQEAVRAGVGGIVFVSAATAPPGVPDGFLPPKRRAEAAIQAMPVRAVILRPGPVFGQRHALHRLPSLLGSLADAVPGLARQLGDQRPLSAAQVGEAIVYAAQDETLSGVVPLSKIAMLAKALAWGL